MKNADKMCQINAAHHRVRGGREVKRRAVEIQQVKAVKSISYADAVKKV